MAFKISLYYSSTEVFSSEIVTDNRIFGTAIPTMSIFIQIQ